MTDAITNERLAEITDALATYAFHAFKDPSRSEMLTIMARLESAETERDELQQGFDLARMASQRAIKMWQAAHPDNKNVWPDMAQLELWLMENLTTTKRALKPFVDTRTHPVQETIKTINKSMHGFTPVTVTVTKDQFLAAVAALEEGGVK